MLYKPAVFIAMDLGARIVVYNTSPYFYHIAQAAHDVLLATRPDAVLLNVHDAPGHVWEPLTTYVIFLAHQHAPMPPRYIVYNFEQLAVNREMSEVFYDRLRSAVAVWDYSVVNVGFLRARGITAHHKPLGFHRAFKSLAPPDHDPRIDVLFIGATNARRRAFIEAARAVCGTTHSLAVVSSVFGDDSLRLMRRTRVVVNCHYYEGGTILEMPRIVPALMNGCIVMSERSADEWYDRQVEGLVVWMDAGSFAGKLKNILALGHEG